MTASSGLVTMMDGAMAYVRDVKAEGVGEHQSPADRL